MASAPPVIREPPRIATLGADNLLPAGWTAGFPGMTLRELQAAVAGGARFVQFQFCVSVVILSFKRTSPIFYVAPGQKAAGKGSAYSLISMLAGWWGFPWGPIWTLTTIATNMAGGKDVTRQVLASLGMGLPVIPPPQYVSPTEVEERERAAARKNWIARAGWVAAGSIVACLAAMVIIPLACFRLPDPGVQEYFDAENSVKNPRLRVDGNKTQAKMLAAEVCAGVIRQLDPVAAASLPEVPGTNDEVRTYCHFGRRKCAFVLHIPRLEEIDAERRANIIDCAWSNAVAAVGWTKGISLAVELRGTNFNCLITNLVGGTEPLAKSEPCTNALQAFHAILPWFIPETGGPKPAGGRTRQRSKPGSDG